MSNPHSSSSETESSTESSNTETVEIADIVRDAIESNRDVRERIQRIVVDLFRGKDGAVQAARDAVHGMIQTASEIVERSSPDKADSVLRNVIDGVTSGLSNVAESTQKAVQEATARGQRFANADVERAKKDLAGITEILVDTAKYFTKRVSEEAGSTLSELKAHADRAVETAKPVVKSSFEALTKHPVQTAEEVATTAIRGSQLTVGALLNAVSGVLAGAAELIDPARRQPSETSGVPKSNVDDETRDQNS